MTELLFVRVVWDRQEIPLKLMGLRMLTLHVGPEPSHPFGRKGLALESAWKQVGQPSHTGMLIIDGDVLIDPHDFVLMWAAIEQDPLAVHVAPAKLWPLTTGEQTWVWGHWRGQPSRELCLDPDFFSFNFTYLPRRLVEASVKAGLRSWVFPDVDRRVSKVAREQGYRIHVVEECQPKHLHF